MWEEGVGEGQVMAGQGCGSGGGAGLELASLAGGKNRREGVGIPIVVEIRPYDGCAPSGELREDCAEPFANMDSRGAAEREVGSGGKYKEIKQIECVGDCTQTAPTRPRNQRDGSEIRWIFRFSYC